MGRGPASAELGESSRVRLEDDALRLVYRRASQGGVAYALLSLGFMITAAVDGDHYALGIAPTLILVALLFVHFVVLAPKSDTPLGARWKRRFLIATITRTVVLSLYIAASSVVDGMGTTTILMLLAVTGLIGRTHTFAPWPTLLRAATLALVIPPAVAALAIGWFGLAALAAILGVHTWVLGIAQHKEYWDGVLANARLEASNEAIAKAQRQTRDLIEKNPDAIALVRGATIVYVNPAWASAELPRAALTDDEASDPLVSAALLELIERPDPATTAREIRVRQPDGTERVWEVVRGAPIEYEGDTATMLVARDVTEQDRLRAQLFLSERLASIGTLAAGVAHEINNPLTYVIANLEFTTTALTEDEWSEDLKREILTVTREARDGAERVRLIVRDLRNFSRAEEGKVVPVDVRKVVELTLKMAAHELRHRARVEVAFEEVPRVLIDEARLGQVLLNIVINAAQAIPEGSSDRNLVRVSTRLSPRGDVLIAVEDTGVGIAPEKLPHIFDPFFTTKPLGVGTGLGLAIVHGIVKSFHGHVSVTSKVGVGTTVTVSFPPGPRERPPSIPEPVSLRPRSGGRILVVDDEVAVGDAVERIFRGRYDVAVEPRAAAALDRLRAGEHFDLVLCDLMMPDMTGMDLFAQLKLDRPGMTQKFVFITGGAFTEGARRFLAEVTNPCVEKPFDARELKRVVLEQVGLPS